MRVQELLPDRSGIGPVLPPRWIALDNADKAAELSGMRHSIDSLTFPKLITPRLKRPNGPHPPRKRIKTGVSKMKQPPPIPPNRQSPLPPKLNRPPSPPSLSQQEYTRNSETPMHPAVLVTALLAIAIIVLIIAWLIMAISRSLPGTTANATQSGAQDSSTTPDEIKMGTGTEETPSQPTHADSDTTDEAASDPSGSQPAEKRNSESEKVDDETSQPPFGETANNSSNHGDTQTNRTRVLNTGSGKRLSAEGTNPFLIGADATSTVFVIDKSSSMSGAAFSSVRNSLLRAIETLNATQRFSVIFFDTTAHPMPPNEMVDADDKGKDLATEFVEKMSPSGSTNPYSATRMALDMHPGAVVVLSDGDFDITEVKRITQENQMDRKTPIHCIGLQSHIRTLQKLAEDNSGTYRTATVSR